MNKTKEALKSKAGRPSAARASAIDRLIIQVAHEMFLADGYDGVAMEQVAFAAKVSKGTLYARHPSKEALFSAVVEASVKQWAEDASVEDHLLTDDIEQRLRHHAATIARSLHKPEVMAVQQLVLSVRDRFPGLANVILDSGYHYILDLIEQDIVAAARRDDRPARDPRAVARVLVGALSGVRIQEGASVSCEQLDDFAQRVVDLVIVGRGAW
jgi:Transcriptional regulator